MSEQVPAAQPFAANAWANPWARQRIKDAPPAVLHRPPPAATGAQVRSAPAPAPKAEAPAAPVAPVSDLPQWNTSLEATVRTAGIPRDITDQVSAWVMDPPKHSRDDASDKREAEAELRALWETADRFEGNHASLNNFLDNMLEPDAAKVLRDARLADGRLLMNDAATIQRLLHAANAKGPALSGSINRQIEQVQAYMRTNSKAYYKNDVLQAKYRELLSQQQAQ